MASEKIRFQNTRVLDTGDREMDSVIIGTKEQIDLRGNPGTILDLGSPVVTYVKVDGSVKNEPSFAFLTPTHGGVSVVIQVTLEKLKPLLTELSRMGWELTNE